MSRQIKLLTYDQIINDNFEKCLPGKALKEFKDEEVMKECDFKDLRFYYLKDYILKNSKKLLEDLKNIEPLYLPFNVDKVRLTEEFVDFLFEFPICVIPKGTLITHSSQIERFFRIKEGEIQFNKNGCFWLEGYKVGQKKFYGGWYTINKTDYGGPKFGLNIIFRFDKAVSLLFIPPIYKKLFLKNDKRYFDNNYYPENYKNIDDYEDNLARISINIQKKLEEDPIYFLSSFLDTNIPFKKFGVINNIVQIINNLKKEIIFENYGPKDLNNINQIFEDLKKYIKENFNNEIKNYKEKISDILEEKNNIDREMSKIEKEKTNFQTLIHYTVDSGFSGSHITEGVEDWYKKGYTKVKRNYESYADELAIKLSLLGFYGYNSCDECEVYISHNLEGILEGPVELQINSEIFFEMVYKNKLLSENDKKNIYEHVMKHLIDNCLPNGGKVFLEKVKDTERQAYTTEWLTFKPF